VCRSGIRRAAILKTARSYRQYQPLPPKLSGVSCLTIEKIRGISRLMDELIREIDEICAKVINEELWPQHFYCKSSDIVVPEDD